MNSQTQVAEKCGDRRTAERLIEICKFDDDDPSEEPVLSSAAANRLVDQMEGYLTCYRGEVDEEMVDAANDAFLASTRDVEAVLVLLNALVKK